MKRLATGLTVLAVLWTAGCSNDDPEAEISEQAAVDRDVEDQTPYEQMYTTADTSEAYRQQGGPAPVTPVQGPQGSSVTPGTGQGELTATGNLIGPNGATAGNVTVTAAGAGGAQIRLTMTEAAPGTRLQATVVQGSCRQPGAAVAQVGEAFQVQPTGIATHVASIQQPAQALLNGRHAVRVASGQGSALACADLPALETR